MNEVTKEIAAMLNVSLWDAQKIQNRMEMNGIDFSECTDRVFKREVNFAVQELAEEGIYFN